VHLTPVLFFSIAIFNQSDSLFVFYIVSVPSLLWFFMNEKRAVVDL